MRSRCGVPIGADCHEAIAIVMVAFDSSTERTLIDTGGPRNVTPPGYDATEIGERAIPPSEKGVHHLLAQVGASKAPEEELLRPLDIL